MRPGGFIVHLRLPHHSALQTVLEDVVTLFHRLQRFNGNVADFHHASFSEARFELGLLFHIFRKKEISEVTFVDFNHVASKLDVKQDHALDDVEHFSDGPWS